VERLGFRPRQEVLLSLWAVMNAPGRANAPGARTHQ
jgi:hypothetical protein